MIAKDISVKSVLSKVILECSPDTRIEEAAGKMRDARCSSIIIVNDENPIGIWTEQDALSLDFDNPQWLDTPISKVMSSPLKTIPDNISLKEVAYRFKNEGVRHFLVADDACKTLGIVSQTDVALRYDSNHFFHERNVHSVMKREFCRISGDISLAEAVRTMQVTAIHAVIVEASDDSGPGIITERDVVRLIAQRLTSSTSSKVASKPLITVSQDASLVSARDVMKEKNIRHLGVINQNGDLTGLLSFGEVMQGIQFEYIHWLEKKLEDRTRELHQSATLFKRLFDNAPIGYQSLDSDGNFIEVNQAWLDMLGYSRAEVIGQTFDKFLVQKKIFKKNFPYFKKIGKMQISGIEMRCQDKSVKIVGINGKISYDDEGNFKQTHCILTDITKSQQAEVALHKAMCEADTANRAKSEFLANMSHDLRTPLNAIMGFAEMMENKTFGSMGNAHYDEYVTHIHKSGALLLDLINDILDLSKIEAGKLKLVEEILDVSSFIRSSVTMIESNAQTAKVDITIEIPPDLPMLNGCRRSLVQILNNLLSNAIKFTPAGGDIRVAAKIDKTGSLLISVADNGIGISRDDIAKVMIPFEQIDSYIAKKNKGTGLGLHLCHELMQLHGGTIKIDSKFGKGTTVSVRFPAERTIVY